MRFRVILFFAILLFNSYSGAVVTMVLPNADRLARLITFSGDMIMMLLAATCMMRNRSFYGVKLFFAFLIAATLTLIYNFESLGLMPQLNGLREPAFFFSSLIVVFDIFESQKREKFVKYFTLFLIVFAISQLPLSVVQFIRYGAADEVGGTYGTGGGSGYVTQVLFLISFYLITRFGSLDHGSTFSIRKTMLFSALLIPCALNETKISFILLPMFLALIMMSRKKMYKAIPFLALGLILAYLLNHYYTANVEDTRNIFDWSYVENYLLTNPTDRGGDLPRFQRLAIMFRLMRNDAVTIFLGMGYGLFGGGNILGVARLGRTLYYLVSGSRILLFTLWIQGGIIAILTVGAAMFSYMRSKHISYYTVRRFSLFVFVSLLAIWAYNDAILDRVFASIVSFMMIWIRNGGLETEKQELALSTAEIAEERVSAEVGNGSYTG